MYCGSSGLRVVLTSSSGSCVLFFVASPSVWTVGRCYFVQTSRGETVVPSRTVRRGRGGRLPACDPSSDQAQGQVSRRNVRVRRRGSGEQAAVRRSPHRDGSRHVSVQDWSGRQGEVRAEHEGGRGQLASIRSQSRPAADILVRAPRPRRPSSEALVRLRSNRMRPHPRRRNRSARLVPLGTSRRRQAKSKAVPAGLCATSCCPRRCRSMLVLCLQHPVRRVRA